MRRRSASGRCWRSIHDPGGNTEGRRVPLPFGERGRGGAGRDGGWQNIARTGGEPAHGTANEGGDGGGGRRVRADDAGEVGPCDAAPGRLRGHLRHGRGSLTTFN